MNKQLDINTRRFSLNVVTLLVGMFVVLVMGASSALAQTATSTDSTATTTTDTTAAKGVAESSLTFAVKGTVNDPSGAINVGGNVTVTAKRVIATESTTTPSVVVLDLDFSAVKGTSGSLKTLTTYITGENHATEIRPFQATDTIVVTCPYFDSTKDVLSARTMLVTVTLNFDVSTGKLTSGSIAVGNNTVTSAMVGTTATAQ
jgi:hypothetical protein